MLLRHLFAAALACSAAFWWPSAAHADSTPRTLDGPAARQWITRLQQAASQRNYAGTQVFSSAGSLSSARVAHYGDGPQQFESIEMLDGQMRRVLRHNEVVYTLWPKKQLAVIEQRPAVSPFPSLPQAVADLFESYELQLVGTDRQAGHDVEVVLLQPRDRLRYAQRLSAESATGLLLKAEILNGRGEVLESVGFSDIVLGVKAQPEAVLASIRKLDGYKVVKLQSVPAQLEAEGWMLRQAPSGFRQISCVKRLLQGPQAEGRDGSLQVLHAIFSDGLTHVSLFVEPFDASRHERPMQILVGATHTLMTRRGDWWLTLVGDVPAETLKRFAAAFDRRKP